MNEKSSSSLACTFTDVNGAPVTHSAATYQIDDESGTSIKVETAFTPPADIQITDLENAILNAANKSERRRVTVKWTYTGGKKGTAEYIYQVKNLTKVS